MQKTINLEKPNETYSFDKPHKRRFNPKKVMRSSHLCEICII